MIGEQIDCIADTSVIIGLLRGDPVVKQEVEGRRFAITFTTLAELSLGVLKAARPDAVWSRVQNVLRGRRNYGVAGE